MRSGSILFIVVIVLLVAGAGRLVYIEYAEGAGRRQQAENTRRGNESRFDPHGVRDRLLARQTAQKAVNDASAGC